MSFPKPPTDAVPSAPAEETAAMPPADARRREALRRLGRGAAYALPATLAIMTINRAAALS